MKIWFVIVAVLMAVSASAQLNGAQWVLGFNTSVLDFRNPDTVTNYVIDPLTPFTITNANICDEGGNLLYFSNGIAIFDRNGGILENGDSLSPCLYTDEYREAGLNIQQAILFIPKPGNNRFYYLFHTSNDTLNNERPGKIYYSLIDREGNHGLGTVIEKNIPIINGVILRDGGMTACKHANGRDYWLIKGATVRNEFYRFLITPDSILGPYTQSIGARYPLPYDNAYSKFSQDGSKYATITIEGYITVMDFDRCSGTFSNPDTIYNNASLDPVNDPATGGVAVEFSSNNRFLYVSNAADIYQYDLWNLDMHDSLVIYNGDSDSYRVDMLQMAPNGKMYGSMWAGGNYSLHVINHPDELGDSCDFIYDGFKTLTLNTVSLPNMINYALGPLQGSGCDTITDIRQETQDARQIRIQPNPADKYVYVEVPRQGNYELQLLNETGQVVDKKQTRQVDIFDTENLPSGLYFIKAVDKQNAEKVPMEKVVVRH